eukprot:m.1839 g.1839  ORF g.1839 m.1839 type:complete len:57 (+) comp7946_c0_seq1:183-353(+)
MRMTTSRFYVLPSREHKIALLRIKSPVCFCVKEFTDGSNDATCDFTLTGFLSVSFV